MGKLAKFTYQPNPIPMKKSYFLLLFSVLFLSASAQNLNFTVWDAYGGQDGLFWGQMSFANDSIYLEQVGSAPYSVAGYTQSGNSITIIDVPGLTSCAAHPGVYNFQIVNDTLSLTATSDTCSERITFLEGETFVGANLSVEERGLEQVSVYPNPTTDRITLKTSQTFIGKEYTLTSVSGQVVGSGMVAEELLEIDVTHLSAGLYIFRIEGQTNGKMKFMKN